VVLEAGVQVQTFRPTTVSEEPTLVQHMPFMHVTVANSTRKTRYYCTRFWDDHKGNVTLHTTGGEVVLENSRIVDAEAVDLTDRLRESNRKRRK
jgi:hypothetical protein